MKKTNQYSLLIKFRFQHGYKLGQFLIIKDNELY